MEQQHLALLERIALQLEHAAQGWRTLLDAIRDAQQAQRGAEAEIRGSLGRLTDELRRLRDDLAEALRTSEGERAVLTQALRTSGTPSQQMPIIPGPATPPPSPEVELSAAGLRVSIGTLSKIARPLAWGASGALGALLVLLGLLARSETVWRAVAELLARR